MDNVKRVKIIITGRVQGVFFRQKTKEEAENLNLVGWVKNTDDGKVMVEAQGVKECLDALISWLRAGPRLAEVKNIEVEWLEPKSDMRGFEIIF
jgi:acylphosphatase